jgi:ABC-2 type transport system ATP-binding protein
MPSAIVLDHVTKRFGQTVAVDALSLEVPAGTIYGFIGPNGSGKTTTLRMIMNILLPDSGHVEVLGDTSTTTARDGVGYLPEERGLYKQMPVRRLLTYYGELKGGQRADVQREADWWLDRLGLPGVADKKVQALSKGMSQKVQFIAAIVARPTLVILDEPFSGLDPVNRDVLRDAVLELKRRGTTIVFSTHDMSMAEMMCDRIFMIFKGRKVLDGSLDQIQATYGHDAVHVRVPGGAAVLRTIAGVESVTDHGNEQQVRLSIDPQTFLSRLTAAATVHRFEITRPSLHDIFVEIARPSSDETAVPVS